MKRTYEEAYKKGDEEFTQWLERKGLDYWAMDDYEWHELVEPLAWNAYYNDNYKIPSIEFGLYVIAEVYGEDMARKYYEECMENEAVA